MKGRELIAWIQHQKAEGLECVLQYQDSGGCYSGGEVVEAPQLAVYKRDSEGHPYNVEISYNSGLTPNCIVF